MSALLPAAEEPDPICLSSLKPIAAYNVVFPARLQITTVESLWTFLVDNKVITRGDISTIKLGYKPPADPKNGFGVFLLLVPNEHLLSFELAVYKFCSKYRCFLVCRRSCKLEDISVSTTTLHIPIRNSFSSFYEKFVPITLAFALRRAGFCSRIVYEEKICREEGLRSWVLECELVYIKSAPTRPPEAHTRKKQEGSGNRGEGYLALEAVKDDACKQVQNAGKRRSGWGGKSRVRNYNRASVFRKWCVDNLGYDRMNSLEGVLDVAGGKGELAYELLAYGRISNVTIVDPRPFNMFGMLKRLTRGHIDRMRRRPTSTTKIVHPTTEGTITTASLDPFEHVSAVLPLPAHVRCWFEYPLPSTNAESVPNECPGELELGKRKSIFASRSLYWNEELKSENDQVQLLMKKMSSCSVVVGMHPDQATEAIVDFAL